MQLTMITADAQDRIDTAIARIQSETTLASFASDRSRTVALVIVDNSPLIPAGPHARRARAMYHLRKRLRLLEGL